MRYASRRRATSLDPVVAGLEEALTGRGWPQGVTDWEDPAGRRRETLATNGRGEDDNSRITRRGERRKQFIRSAGRVLGERQISFLLYGIGAMGKDRRRSHALGEVEWGQIAQGKGEERGCGIAADRTMSPWWNVAPKRCLLFSLSRL